MEEFLSEKIRDFVSSLYNQIGCRTNHKEWLFWYVFHDLTSAEREMVFQTPNNR